MAADAPSLEIDRRQVLAHRIVTQGLDRTTDDPADLDVVDLGLQESPGGSAVLAAWARVTAQPASLDDGRRWASAWTVRGAPHVHRRGDLPGLAAALWPVDDDDAVARLAGNGDQIKQAGADALAILRATAEALAEVVDDRMTKGEASEAVTPQTPEEGVTWCRGCDTHHVGEQLMRLAALPAGLRLVPGAKPATLEPIPGWAGPPEATDGLGTLITAYLRSHGPARRGDVAAYFDARPAVIEAAWPRSDVVEVSVERRSCWVAAHALDALRRPPAPRLTRLLARSDPWLTARDRELTVPDKDHRKEVWKILGSPGALLVDGEVVGTWRARAKGRGLAVSVAPFGDLAPRTVRELTAEAERVAITRGANDVAVDIGPCDS